MGILKTLLDHLKNGEATFEFRTSEGRIRRSRGTLNQNLIPRDEWASGATFKRPIPKFDETSVKMKGFQAFYDLDISKWRRFKAFNVIRVISFKPFKGKNFDFDPDDL
jgi:hypothetical protein